MASKFDQKTFIITMFIILVTWASRAMSRAMLQEASIVELHEKWMAQFGRTYVDSAEKEKRFKIFKENYEYVERFNNAGNNMTYKLGINAFSDLTDEEFQASHTGSKMPISNPRFSKTTTPFKYQNLTNEVPENVDWRDQGVVTDVKNQGRCACFWAFSAVAAVEGIVKIKTGELQQLSEQQLLDCVQLGNDCSGGNMESAYDYIVENSITSESNYQYQERKGPCDQAKAAKKAAEIIGSIKIANANEMQLKVFVARQPISAYINTDGDFRQYTVGIYNGNCKDSINHAVVIVGYGVSEDGTKFWILKNSWGTGWGERGYMRIIRESGFPKGPCGILTMPSFPDAQ